MICDSLLKTSLLQVDSQNLLGSQDPVLFAPLCFMKIKKLPVIDLTI